LMAARVNFFNIEGRYKNAAYVMSAVDSLRNYRDALLAGERARGEQRLREDLERTQLTFSRGASPGFLRGDDHQSLVVGKTPKHRGIALGRVREVRGTRVRLELEPARRERALPRAGMGVMFELGDPERDEARGGPIFSVRSVSPELLELGFGDPGPALERVKPGTAVWLTGDPELAREAERRVRQPLAGRIALELDVSGASGAPLVVQACAVFAGRRLLARVQSSSPLTAARAAGLGEALLRDKLGSLGGSAFRLGSLQLSGLEPGLHLPVSELKQLRRTLVDALEAQLRTSQLAPIRERSVLGELRARTSQLTAAESAPQLVPLCRTLEQLEALLGAQLLEHGDEVELDFMEFVGLRAAVDRARAAGLSVSLATVRVQKPGEESYDRRIAALRPDAVLVRHWGALMHFAEQQAAAELGAPRVHGDFSLNVTNSLSARHLLGLGLHTLTASHDLDRQQLLELLEQLPRGRIALTLHHHMPTFHNSHCVYAHLLSEGRDYRSCGRPCETHRVALRDFAGHDHPVLVDVGCRNTVFNAQAQSAAPLVPQLLERGVQRFRVEFVWESAEEVERTFRAYRGLLAGQLSANEALRRVGVHEQYGVTTLRGARTLTTTTAER
jgi:putative protease